MCTPQSPAETVTVAEQNMTMQYSEERTDDLICRRDSSTKQLPLTWSLGEYFKLCSMGKTPAVDMAMSNELLRVGSFCSFPRDIDIYCIRLAQAGFYYTGSGKETKCYVCGVIYRDWISGDVPQAIHKRIFPSCRLVITNDSTKTGKKHLDPREMPNEFLDDPSRSTTSGQNTSTKDLTQGRVESLAAAQEQNSTSIERHMSPNVLTKFQSDDTNLKSVAVLMIGNKQLLEQRLCKECYDLEANILLLGCFHIACCSDCSPHVLKCPICSTNVQGTLEVESSELFASSLNPTHNVTIDASSQNNQHSDQNSQLNTVAARSVLMIGYSTKDIQIAMQMIRERSPDRTIQTVDIMQELHSSEGLMNPGMQGLATTSRQNTSSEDLAIGVEFLATAQEQKNTFTSDLLAVLEEEKELLLQQRLCKNCHDLEANIFFRSCCHIACCSYCAKDMHECPICNTYVTGKVEVYYP